MTHSGYRYYRGSEGRPGKRKDTLPDAIQLGMARLHPDLRNPDYLILRERNKWISKWISGVEGDRLSVLDVGGRIQPYRPLMERRLFRYIAIDPQLEGLVDIVAVGSDLPFRDEVFDIVICTQVLGYVPDPFAVVREMHRVLKPGGALIFSAPEFSIRHHDERWRFLPEGLQVLFSGFYRIEIRPEGYSVCCFFRTINACLYFFTKSDRLRKWITATLIPLFNIVGRVIDRLYRGNDRLVANNCVFARK